LADQNLRYNLLLAEPETEEDDAILSKSLSTYLDDISNDSKLLGE